MTNQQVGRPQRRALAEWALEQIYELIFTGQLAAGADLGEDDLCQRLSVSRTTISAALRQLEADGVAVVQKGNGKRVVTSFGLDDINELYTIRAALEELGAGAASLEIQPEVLQQLEDIQEELEKRANPDRDPQRRGFEVDFDFHRVMIRASGMVRLEAALGPVWNQTRALLRQAYSLGVYGDLVEDAEAHADHRRILRALREGDPAASQLAMHDHLINRRDRLMTGVASLSPQTAGQHSMRRSK